MFDVFIDHTSLHSLAISSSSVPAEYTGFRARELFHLMELLLLADGVRLGNTEMGTTLEMSQRLVEQLSGAGFQDDTREQPLVQIANVSEHDTRLAIERAAPMIYDSLSKVEWPALAREGFPTNYRLRPIAVEKVDFTTVSTIPFGSGQSEEFITAAIKSRQWRSTSAAVLCSPLLYAWTRKFARSRWHQDEYLRTFTNVVFRSSINREMARLVLTAGDPASSGAYVPAYGRSLALQRNAEFEWAQLLPLLEQKLNYPMRQWIGEDMCRALLSVLGPTIDADLPMVGLWALSQASRCRDVPSLLERLVVLREHDYSKVVRAWLSDPKTDADDLDHVACEVARRLGVRESGSTTGKLTVKIRLLPFPALIAEVAGDQVQGLLDRSSVKTFARRLQRRFLRVITGKREAIALTGMITDIESRPELYRPFQRLSSLLSTL